MEAWLQARHQAEAECRLTKKKPLNISRPVYFGTRRCTQSDVMSVITTTRVVEENDYCLKTSKWIQGLTPPALTKVTLPVPLASKENDIFVKKNYTHPYNSGAAKDSSMGREEPDNEMINFKLSQQMRQEKGDFMKKLTLRRKTRAELEYLSARKIQTLVRGFIMRRWLKKNSFKLRARRKMKQSYQIITNQINLKMQMEENKKRAEERRERGSILIQSICRMHLAIKAARKERFFRHIERLNEAQVIIAVAMRTFIAKRQKLLLEMRLHKEKMLKATIKLQTIFRSQAAQNIAASRTLIFRRVAAFVIQRNLRRHFAVQALIAERERQNEFKQNLSVIEIQRIVRGFVSRKKVLKLREEGQADIEDAAALTIQRVFRGYFGRAVFKFRTNIQLHEQKNIAAYKITKVIRGFLGRIYAKKCCTQLESDIFYQTRLGNKSLVEDLFAGFGTDTVYTIESTDIKGNSIFSIACKFGHKKIARKCLKWGMDMNHMNDNGDTPVMLATRAGYAELAEYLVAKKATLTKEGRTLLHDACMYGMKDLCYALLLRGVEVNAIDPETGRNALQFACATPTDPTHKDLHSDTVVHDNTIVTLINLLIEYGVTLDCKDKTGATALHLAAFYGRIVVVQKLIDMGAEASVRDNLGHTPWRKALLGGHQDCAEILRKQWTNFVSTEQEFFNAQSVPNEEVKKIIKLIREAGDEAIMELQAALQAGLPISIQEESTKTTMLMAAVSVSAPKIVNLLLESSSANMINLTDSDGRNALHHANGAAGKDIEDKDKSIVKNLIGAGCDIFLKDSIDQSTPLHTACEQGFYTEDISKCIKKDGRTISNLIDRNGRTPLHRAGKGANRFAIDELLTLGASPNEKDNFGRTVLHYAAANNSSAGRLCVVDLLSKGSDPNWVDEKLQTPLHIASESCATPVIGPLMDAGCNPLQLDADGLTPLHIAARKGQLPCLNLLFSNGARIDASFAISPLYFAVLEDNDHCIELLLRKGSKTNERYPHEGNGTALHVAARVNAFKSCSKILSFQNDQENFEGSYTNGRNVGDLLQMKDANGSKPLHIAVASGSAETVECLIQAGAKATLEEEAEKTLALPGISESSPIGDRNLLHLCAGMNSKGAESDSKLINLLYEQLRREKQFNTQTENLVELLQEDAVGLTPLHIAAASNNAAILESLLLFVQTENGGEAILELPDSRSKRTLLHYAAVSGSLETVELLVNRGADQEATDDEGLTPMQLAANAPEDSVRPGTPVVEFLLLRSNEATQ